MKEMYFSVDVETDGPIPGLNSMLSLGCAAFHSDGHMQATFERNLELLAGAHPNPQTTKFWAENQAAYAATRVNVMPPQEAMLDFVSWVKSFHNVLPVMVCMPAGFDFTFVYWYMMAFTGQSPFSFSCIDMKTFAMAKLHKPYRAMSKRNWPSRWFQAGRPHTHIALDDAIEQGEIFIRMLHD